MKATKLTIVIIVVLGGAFLLYNKSNQFDLPRGETTPFMEEEADQLETMDSGETKDEITEGTANKLARSNRQVFVTDGVKHSIPLGEILSGGPPKDGIPSIDEPKFYSLSEAQSKIDFLSDESVGLGLEVNGEKRFYPYQILVWHEIVNDEILGTPVLVTYCPLCATGVVFDPVVEGKRYEFGVSGKLWQSNLLMYNRTADPNDETLWSQVLGEGVLGPLTGTKLPIISADTVKFGDWKEKHPDTKVLSTDTGAFRSYTRDPYGDYYTDNSAVGFGAKFTDKRLEAKDFVLGVEIGEQYKAYLALAIPEGEMKDSFAGQEITITKDKTGSIRMFTGSTELSYIGGFWFSWAAVHPETEVFK